MATSADRLKEYERLFAQQQQYNPAKFQQEFERGYGEATNYNKDLISDRNTAVSQLQSLPSQLREQYYSSPVRNPLQQEALITGRTANVSNDIGTLTDLLTARKGRYEDVLGNQLQAYLADQQNAATAAENAWRLYQDALAREQAAKGSGGSGSIADILAALGLTGGAGGGGGGEKEPLYEIPEGGITLGNSFEDRLTKDVMEHQSQKGLGNVLKSYFKTSAEPLKQIKSFSDILNIPSRSVASTYTIYSDLFNRLFK